MIDEKEVRKAIALMNPDNDLFEVRIIHSNKKVTSGYFKDADTLITALNRLPSSKSNNVYITLNMINEQCYGREQKDKFVEMPKATTSDSEIVGYKWIMVDLDPKRPSDTSASEEEIAKAKSKGNEIYKFLKDKGFEKPLFAMSGNGVHLLYKVAIVNTPENVILIKNFLAVLDMLFSDDVISIDLKNFNPSRICKLYGTQAMKGSDTSDRPHRMSRALQSASDTIKVNDKSFIEKIVAMLPKERKPEKYNNFTPRDFDLDEWLDKYYIRYTKTAYSSGTKYILDECPFDSNHKGKDAVLFKGSNGAIGFNCFHNSCNGHTWQDMRLLFEPDAYDRKYEQPYRQPNYKNENYQVVEVKEIKEVEGKPVFLTTEQIRLMKTPEEEYIPSGIDIIDRKLGGLKKGYVSVITGLSASGKSSIISQITLDTIQNDYRVALFSGELTPQNLTKWLYLQCAGKNNVKPTFYENKFVVPEEIKKKMSKWLDEKLYIYNNDYGNSFSQIKIQLKKCVIDYKVDLIILDNLMALNIADLDKDVFSRQSKFVQELEDFAKACNIHIVFVAHPRKTQGFLRIEDISGSNDIRNRVDNGFVVHRVNKDFQDNYAAKFQRSSDVDFPRATNVIEICKDRDNGTQDCFIPLYFEVETKRLRNEISEYKHYGWESSDGFVKTTKEEQIEIDENIFS